VLPTASYALNQLYLLSELASGFTCTWEGQTLALGGWFRQENHTCLSLFIYIYIYICVYNLGYLPYLYLYVFFNADTVYPITYGLFKYYSYLLYSILSTVYPTYVRFLLILFYVFQLQGHDLWLLTFFRFAAHFKK